MTFDLFLLNKIRFNPRVNEFFHCVLQFYLPHLPGTYQRYIRFLFLEKTADFELNDSSRIEMIINYGIIAENIGCV